MNFKKILSLIFIIILVLIGVVYIYQSNNYRDLRKKFSQSTEYVVHINKSELTEQEILDIFGKGSVNKVSDDYYTLKLSKENIEKINERNLNYNFLEQSVPRSNNKKIYLVTLKPPIIISKVQDLANYGALVDEYDNNKYLIWSTEIDISDLTSLESVIEISDYYIHQRISDNVFSNLSTKDKIEVNIKLLLEDPAYLNKIISDIESLDGQVLEEIDSRIMSSNIDSIVLKVEIPGNRIIKLLQKYPEIVYAR